MKLLLPFLLLLVLALAFAGCASYDAHLPDVSASEVHIKHVDSLGSVTIDATEVAVTDTEVTAKSYKRVVAYPVTHDEVEIVGYHRPRNHVGAAAIP